MSPKALYATQESRHTRFHRRRKRSERKLRVILLILGILSPVIGGLTALFAYFFSVANQMRLYRLSLYYVGAGAVLLVLYAIARLLKNLSDHRRAKQQAAYQRYLKRKMEAAPGGASGATPAGQAPKSGMALILVLVAAALLSGLVLNIQANARALAQQEKAALVQEQLRSTLAQDVREHLKLLADDADLLVDHPREDWAKPRELSHPSGIATRLCTTDASAAFALNNLAAAYDPATRPATDVLVDLFNLCGDFSPATRLDALADWMDENDTGAYERNYYATREPPYAPANRRLWAPAEVLQVAGFERALFAKRETTRPYDAFQGVLAECAMVIPAVEPDPLPINLNTANRETLQGVLGMGQEEAVRTILGLRDITPLRSPDLLANINPDLFKWVRKHVAVNSRHYVVRARAYYEGQTARVHVWAQRDPQGAVRITRWVFQES